MLYQLNENEEEEITTQYNNWRRIALHSAQGPISH